MIAPRIENLRGGLASHWTVALRDVSVSDCELRFTIHTGLYNDRTISVRPDFEFDARNRVLLRNIDLRELSPTFSRYLVREDSLFRIALITRAGEPQATFQTVSDSVLSPSSFVDLWIRDSVGARRVHEAIAHAAQLCGARPGAF